MLEEQIEGLIHLPVLSHTSVGFVHKTGHFSFLLQVFCPDWFSTHVGLDKSDREQSLFKEQGVAHSLFILQIAVGVLQTSLHSCGSTHILLPSTISLHTEVDGLAQSEFEEHGVMHFPFVSHKSVDFVQGTRHTSGASHFLLPLMSSLQTGLSFEQSLFVMQSLVTGVLQEPSGEQN